jgi:hypothetical protein
MTSTPSEKHAAGQGEHRVEDERPYLAWETPTRLSEIDPQAEPRRCTECRRSGIETFHPADKVVIVKHRHEGQPLGQLTTHCPDHPPDRDWVSGDRHNRTGGICPNCFVQMPLSDVCPMCG